MHHRENLLIGLGDMFIKKSKGKNIRCLLGRNSEMNWVWMIVGKNISHHSIQNDCSDFVVLIMLEAQYEVL